jgi:hypothetical protein
MYKFVNKFVDLFELLQTLNGRESLFTFPAALSFPVSNGFFLLHGPL